MSLEKAYTLAECKEHTTEKSCWVIIHGKVYDVTNFLEEHPGGYDVVVTSAGRDATEDFDQIGHSNSAKKQLADYLIGTYEGGDSAPVHEETKKQVTVAAPKSEFSRLFSILLPVILLAIAVALNMYSSSQPKA